MGRYGIPKLDNIETEIRDLLNLHGLADWTFEWDTAGKRYGCCYWERKHITLSMMLCVLNSRSETTQTILHEIGHALVGREHGHNRHWLNTARSIGYIGGRCYSRAVVLADSLPSKRS